MIKILIYLVAHSQYNVSEYVYLDWLRQYLVHTAFDGFVDVFLFRVPGHSRYNRLGQPLRKDILPYLATSLITVQIRHLTVHKNQIIGAPLVSINILNIMHYFLQRFLTTHGLLDMQIDI